MILPIQCINPPRKTHLVLEHQHTGFNIYSNTSVKQYHIRQGFIPRGRRSNVILIFLATNHYPNISTVRSNEKTKDLISWRKFNPPSCNESHLVKISSLFRKLFKWRIRKIFFHMNVHCMDICLDRFVSHPFEMKHKESLTHQKRGSHILLLFQPGYHFCGCYHFDICDETSYVVIIALFGISVVTIFPKSISI